MSMKSKLWTRLHQEYHILLDYIYPRFCLVCEESLSFTPHLYLCPSCFSKIPLTLLKRCKRCGQKHGLYTTYCGRCSPRRYPWTQFYGAYDYQGGLIPLIQNWKKGKVPAYGRVLSFFFQKALEQWTPPEADVLIPVPLSRYGLAQRGFNTAEVLARQLSQHWKIPVETQILQRLPILEGQKEQKSQKMLCYQERQKNLKGAFFCKKKPPLRVILVDDVCTTGSTLKEVAETLKQAGVRKIFCVVFARTPRYHF
jgi:ComF family protein